MSETEINHHSQPLHVELNQPESEVVNIDEDQGLPVANPSTRSETQHKAAETTLTVASAPPVVSKPRFNASPIPTKLLIADLKAHPLNALIYGSEDEDPNLVESIRKNGIQETPAVTPDGIIVSGHRRIRAASVLGLKEIDVIVKPFSDDAELELALIECNRQRVKSNETVAREAKRLLEIETELAKKRQISGSRKEAQAQQKKGAARDIVGATLGISGLTVDKAITTVEEIDRLRAEGKNEDAADVEAALAKSVHSGHAKAIAKRGGKSSTKLGKAKAKKAAPSAVPPASVPQSAPPKPPQEAASKHEKENEWSSPYGTCESPEVTTHGAAIGAMNAVVLYLENLDQRKLKDGQIEEWRETADAFANALKDAGLQAS